jgi:hypothetical protein
VSVTEWVNEGKLDMLEVKDNKGEREGDLEKKGENKIEDVAD